MIAVLQRVRSAAVTADGVPTGRIGEGLFILLGVLTGDTEEDARLLAEKIAKLRIFCDAEGDLLPIIVAQNTLLDFVRFVAVHNIFLKL